MPDGVVPARRTGTGAVRCPVPVAPGILPDGRKGTIDLQPARGESAAERERPPDSLHRRGPAGEGLGMIRADGGNGLPAALPPAYPDISVRRRRAHRIRIVPDKLRRRDREDAKGHLHNIMNAPNITAARRFADRRRDAHPKAVECLRDDPDDLPARFRYPTPDGRRQVRTTNAFERRFREVRRSTCLRNRPPGAQRGVSPSRRLFGPAPSDWAYGLPHAS